VVQEGVKSIKIVTSQRNRQKAHWTPSEEQDHDDRSGTAQNHAEYDEAHRAQMDSGRSMILESMLQYSFVFKHETI
jgi:hypothetical protein